MALNILRTDMDISIRIYISQTIIIAKSAIKTFLISLIISLRSDTHKQHGANEDYLIFSKYLDTLEMFQT